MSSLLWVIVVIVGIPILLFLFHILLGFLVSVETKGKMYLKSELKKMGIDQDLIPERCISKLVKEAIESAKLEKYAGNYFNNSFVRNLDYIANDIRICIANQDEKKLKPMFGEEDIYREIFMHYNISTNKNVENNKSHSTIKNKKMENLKKLKLIIISTLHL